MDRKCNHHQISAVVHKQRYSRGWIGNLRLPIHENPIHRLQTRLRCACIDHWVVVRRTGQIESYER